MPKSRSLKEDVRPMLPEETPQKIMSEAKGMMSSARNTMTRSNILMMGAQAMIAKKKRQKSSEADDAMEYSDLGGLNFNPKKLKRRKR